MQMRKKRKIAQSYGVTVMSLVLKKWYAVRISVLSSGFILIAWGLGLLQTENDTVQKLPNFSKGKSSK